MKTPKIMPSSKPTRAVLASARAITKTMIIGAGLTLAGCATHRPSSDELANRSASETAHRKLSDSSIDISYVLGHSHRRFMAWAKNDAFGGQTLVDHQILRESGIDRRRYSEFLDKVSAFIQSPHRKPADQPATGLTSAPPAASEPEETCRTPFTVTLRVGIESKTLQGCRGEDEGALSHIVRDGEFLLYSVK